MSRTKIVATIGPATCSPEHLRALAAAGMTVARLNASHADPAWHAAAIAMVRATLPGVPILLDVPGRKIRTAQLASDIRFSRGDELVLTSDSGPLNDRRIPLNRADAHANVRPNMRILADDGTITLTVLSVTGHDIRCRAEVDGTLGSRKGINVPGMRLSDELFTPRDREWLGFAAQHAVDFIGLSFVETGSHVRQARDLLGTRPPLVLAKIETQRGVEQLAEILVEADALMIDRGDLSADVQLADLAILQKHILSVSRSAGKPVIVATEMLHTMITNRAPTKAEVADITNAVLDGCAATMLSGETAVGSYPVEAVTVMRQIATAAEAHLQNTLDAPHEEDRQKIPEVTAQAVALICRLLPVTRIIAVTRLGYAARAIAALQPRQPILAVSNDAAAARSFNLLPGTEGVFIDVPFERSSTDHVLACLRHLWKAGKLHREDLVLVCALAYPKSGNRMNHVETHVVGDLVDALQWAE